MFKKLLSNLPFNPSLLGQVTFYTQRLKRESFVRGTGLITLALALVIQTFAVISPPQQSLAESPNDIVRGGFTSKAQFVQQCVNNTQGVKTILEYYGVTCTAVSEKATTLTIKSTDHGKELDSLGRTPQGATIYRPLTNKTNQTNEYKVPIAGVGTLYMKNLWSWDSYSSSSYKVLKLTNKYNDTIYIMYDCGNIVTVGKFTPPPPPPEEPPVITTTDACPNIPGTQTSTAECDVCPNVAGTQTTTAQCDVCPNVAGTQSTAAQCDVCPNIPGAQATMSQCDVCPNIPGEQTTANQCYPCPAAETNSEATACLSFDKTALNQTRGIANANNTKAQAGDVISYTLTVKNTGKVEFKDFVFDENLADVLEYASMHDFGGGSLQGDNHLVWPKRSIPAGESIKVQFGVKVKSPIPSTPASASDPGSYDLCMVNVFYDKTITVCVDAPVSKQIEVVATSLPKTGPGTSLMISAGIMTLVGYFFARNRLMVEELTIVRDEFAAGGPA